MAFDRSAGYAAADAAAQVYSELGRAYVTPDEEETAAAVLDPARAELMCAWAATLIPGDASWPDGAEVGTVGYVDRTLALAPRLRPLVLQALDGAEAESYRRLGVGFGAAGAEGRIETLMTLEAQQPEGFKLLQELTYEAYYRHPAVAGALATRTGFRTRTPVDGESLEPFDNVLLLLGEVAQRPSGVREVPQ